RHDGIQPRSINASMEAGRSSTRIGRTSSRKSSGPQTRARRVHRDVDRRRDQTTGDCEGEVGSPQVPDEFWVTCPFCGEQLEIYVEPDVSGSFVQDCEVCCNPWRVHVSGRDEDRAVYVTRADGSE